MNRLLPGLGWNAVPS